MDVLRQTLVELLREPVGGPLDHELVIVPNRGLGRWLEMGLAADQGICAQTRLAFPRRLICQILDSALGPDRAQDAYQPEAMAWALYGLIPRWLAQGRGDELADYWQANPSPASRFALCRELARIYDLAIIYRPQNVVKWGQAPQDWPEDLFGALARQLGPEAHLAARIQHYLNGGYEARLPQRLSLFGLGCLPPAFIGLIHEAARRQGCFVYQFQLNPSSGLFVDATTARQQHHLLHGEGLLEAEAHLTTVHPLLASWGGLARAQQRQQIALSFDDERPLYYPAEGEGTLPRLQRDLCDLVDRFERPRGQPPRAGDHSLRIHRCHGALREVEVLKDQILDLLERQADLEPQDIAVLSTDPKTYGPLIQAVFAPELFVSTADLSQADGDDLAQAVGQALEVAQGGLELDSVVDLLNLEVLQRHWRLQGGRVGDLAQLLQRAGIEGARDGLHRAQMSQAGGDARTWKEGLERLALGLAMPSGFDQVVQDRLPVDPGGPEALEQVVGILDALFELQRCLQTEGTVVAGMGALEAALVGLLGPRVERELGSSFDQLTQSAQWAGEVSLPVHLLAQGLQELLDQEAEGGQFLAGGVTVSGLQPLRAVPFQAIYVLGLGASEQPFPRPALGGDLKQRILGPSRPGDRDRRQEDLDLFLQLLLSARRELGLFVSSVSVDDGSEAPVSVVVDQLLDLVVADACAPDAGIDVQASRDELWRHWVIDHPLQPFDPRAFSRQETGGSFAQIYRHEARQKPFGWAGCSAPEEIDLTRLASWFYDSLSEALDTDLGLRLRPWLRANPEPTQQALPARTRHQLVLRLLEDPDKNQAWLEASGQLTPGHLGLFQAGEVLKLVEACPVPPIRPGPPLVVDLSLAGRQLVGRLPAEAMWIEPQAKGPAFGAWLQHLVRQVMVGPTETRVLFNASGKSPWKELTLPAAAADDARDRLEALVKLYCEGMKQGWVFVGEVASAFAAVRAQATTPGDTEAWHQARQVWWNYRNRPHLRRCLGPDAAFPGERQDWFERLVTEAFLPAYLDMEGP